VIRVVVADLTTLAVDAVLRSSDERLAAVSPAGSRLDEAGGQRFTEQRRLSTELEAGAAVVTGAGALRAPYVVHVVIRDPVKRGGRDVVRRALVSAWQRAGDWGLVSLAAPLVGADAGQLSTQEAAGLLVETFPREASAGPPLELHIVVEQEEERAMVEAIVRRSA
jgi:O-acetyl-ADP-ribose deacetylase (regulator of RNase III)